MFKKKWEHVIQVSMSFARELVSKFLHELSRSSDLIGSKAYRKHRVRKPDPLMEEVATVRYQITSTGIRLGWTADDDRCPLDFVTLDAFPVLMPHWSCGMNSQAPFSFILLLRLRPSLHPPLLLQKLQKHMLTGHPSRP